jgi:cytochrome b6-f complex iron-sulfur subunit
VPGTPIVSRRTVLQTSFWTGIGAVLAGMGACGLDIIYPSTVTGFGGSVSVPKSAIPAPGEKVQIAAGRFWLVNLTAEQGGPGLLALWWRCPHLGCTVPWRPSFSWPDPATGQIKLGWFRCPCHGSTYTDAGVRVFGPAPRSMDTMAISVTGSGDLSVDTGSRLNGGPDNPDRAVRI